MAGFFIGVLCGGAELFLLQKISLAVQEGATLKVGVIFLFKLIVLAAAFAPVVIFLRPQILWCGVGVSAALVAGAFISFIVRGKRSKKSGGELE